MSGGCDRRRTGPVVHTWFGRAAVVEVTASSGVGVLMTRSLSRSTWALCGSSAGSEWLSSLL